MATSVTPMGGRVAGPEAEGLLTHRLHQGYFVADLSTDEFRQIVASR